MNGDEAFVQELARDFTSEARADLTRMDRSLSARDASGIAKAAHNLKGSASSLCAEPLASRADELEHLAKNNALEAAASQIENLKSEVERCIACLDENAPASKTSKMSLDPDHGRSQTGSAGPGLERGSS